MQAHSEELKFGETGGKLNDLWEKDNFIESFLYMYSSDLSAENGQ